MSAVLVDTTVWVDHFRNGNSNLQALLNQDRALTHPMVIGEIACGTPPGPRQHTLDNLRLLPMAQQASITETIELIEHETLYGHGCGLVDLVLLASTLITPGAVLWTMDRRLSDLARKLGVGYQLSLH